MRIATTALAACSVLLLAAADGEPRRASLEAQVLDRINEARQNPRDFADVLRHYRRHLDGNIAYMPDRPNGVITSEGIHAVDEAIAFLERQQPLPPLNAGQVLALAARDHAEEQGFAGATGHVSANGAGPGQRVRRRGGDVYVSESISYGPGDADGVVRQLIVDDGVPGRGHRTLMFQRGLRYAGVGCGEHRRFGNMCVIDFAATSDGNPQLPQSAGR